MTDGYFLPYTSRPKTEETEDLSESEEVETRQNECTEDIFWNIPE